MLNRFHCSGDNFTILWLLGFQIGIDCVNGFCADPPAIMAFRMLAATRVEMTYGGTTIRKEPDGAIVPTSLLPDCTDPDQSGLVVFEGAVFNESIARVVTELLFWLAGARCQVSVS